MAEPWVPFDGGAPAQPAPWDIQAHAPALQALLPGLAIEVLPLVGSTNDHLLEPVRPRDARRDDPTAGASRRAADLQPRLLVAERQTAGRGRRGRRWHSAPGASLTFSLALPLQPRSWSGLSLAVGVALADALDPAEVAAPRIGLKWPNDLWLREAPGRGRKLGGILIETAPVGTQRLAVIGIGLNVRPQAPPPDLACGFACLQELDPALDAPAALWRVAAPLLRALRRFEHDGLAPFRPAYARRDLLDGQPVTTSDPALPEGVGAGIDDEGALCVRVGAALRRVVGGEVSVRPAG
jgi:BirA family biotin operon repressor/biotin-[acetyl-CoA-carboxylase] ligase